MVSEFEAALCRRVELLEDLIGEVVDADTDGDIESVDWPDAARTYIARAHAALVGEPLEGSG